MTPQEPRGGEGLKGWFIREEDGRWTFTDKRIAAVAALTEGFEVCPTAPSASGGEAVAWRVKDFADGWILFADEAFARSEANGAGNLVQPLFAHPARMPTRGQIINAVCHSSPFGPDYKHPDLLRISEAILALFHTGETKGDGA